jgi:hypothetical protein
VTLTEFLLARIADDESWAALQSSFVSRMVAECEAKRRIVAIHRPETYLDLPTQFCVVCRAGPFERTVDFPCATLRALALPYADHPDYCREWVW